MKQIPVNQDKVKCASASNGELLKQRMAYPMKAKLALTKDRIIEWYEHYDGQVYVAFSGGKDSTALLHIVRSIYPKVPFVGTMTEESSRRQTTYLKTGCNAYEQSNPRSAPMSFWTENDVWEYIKEFNVPYSTIYDMGYKRTGCVFCPLGVQYECGTDEPNRFQKLAKTHPKLHKYAMEDLGYREKLAYIGVTELD